MWFDPVYTVAALQNVLAQLPDDALLCIDMEPAAGTGLVVSYFEAENKVLIDSV